MDAVRNILNWLSQNSRNLSEAQKTEIHHVLESLINQLEIRTGMGSNSRDSRAHQFSRKMASMSDRNEKKIHEMNNKVDIKHASLESKIQQITNIISKETGYINGKIDTITKEYNEQMEMLKNQMKDLENVKNKREREKSEVSDRDIDQLTESLRGLMNSFVPKPSPYPPNFNPPPPPPYYDCPPPYHSYSPMVPNQNISYIPTHSSPQFFVAPGLPGPSIVQSSFSFPSNNLGSNLSKSLSCDKNEKVYRFIGSSGYGPSGRVDLNATIGNTHQKTHFNKPFPSANDGKTDCNSRKKYCDPNWKKTDIRHQQYGSKQNPSNEANVKSHHEASSHKDHVSGSYNKYCGTAPFKSYADRGRNKRYQQFGKNRPQNHDDGGDSDTSTTSHVSSKDCRNKSNVSKPGHPHNRKEAKNKCLQSTFTEKPTNFQSRAKNISSFGGGENRHTSTVSSEFPKSFRKEPASKAEISDPCTSKTTTKKNPQSTTKSDTSELEKLQYPSRAEALKRGIDIFKRIDPPSTCLGKVNGIPFSKPAHCLEDIYNFEKEFGPCQVIRY